MAPLSLRLTDHIEYVESALPTTPARVLDVGCGHGGVAAALGMRGHQVTAIDSDPQAVQVARDGGVAAVVADIAQYDEPAAYDVVVFGWSLHHLHDLPAVVERVESLLKPGGVLVVDEFAHDEGTAAFAAFFYGMEQVVRATGLVPDSAEGSTDHADGTVERAVPNHHPPASESAPESENALAAAVEDPLVTWRREHEHDPPLHDGATMLEELGRRFDLTSVERCGYVWRYLSDHLPPDDRGCLLAEALRMMERGLITSAVIPALGLRIVAHPRR